MASEVGREVNREVNREASRVGSEGNRLAEDDRGREADDPDPEEADPGVDGPEVDAILEDDPVVDAMAVAIAIAVVRSATT